MLFRSQIPHQWATAQTLHEFPLADVQLTTAWLQERERLDTTFLNSVDVDRLLHCFRLTAGLPSEAQPLTGWEAPSIGLRGHFTGHYLSALSTLVFRYHDAAQTERLRYLIDELGRCQQANGYLSAFPEQDFDTLEKNITFGVWAPYYTLHKLMQGLLDAYQLAGNETSLTIVRRMADWACQRMERLAPELRERLLETRQANPANETGAMNEVLFRLYAVTGDKTYLALARTFSPEWLLKPLEHGEDILSGLHANTHLVLVNGFAQGYEQTGDERYCRATLNFWDMLLSGHTYVNGSSSGPRPNATTRTSMTAEHWGEAGHLSNTLSTEIAESCVSHNTLRLASYLFSWTGDARYADAAQNLFYNAVLPVQSPSNGDVVYHLPLGTPRTKKYLNPTDFYCCSGSSTEAFTRLAAGTYWHTDTVLYVNRLMPSVLDWKERGIRIEQTGNFPMDSVVSIKVHTRKRQHFSLRVLIPSWESGKARYQTYSQQWRDGDEVRIVLHPRFRLETLSGDPRRVAVCYGPLLLAFEGGEELAELPLKRDEMLQALRVDNLAEGRFSLQLPDQTLHLRPLFTIDREAYSVYVGIQ